MHNVKPNIIFILIDDMGWRDLKCFGSSFYETPNIDKLANTIGGLSGIEYSKLFKFALPDDSYESHTH